MNRQRQYPENWENKHEEREGRDFRNTHQGYEEARCIAGNHFFIRAKGTYDTFCGSPKCQSQPM